MDLHSGPRVPGPELGQQPLPRAHSPQFYICDVLLFPVAQVIIVVVSEGMASSQLLGGKAPQNSEA